MYVLPCYPCLEFTAPKLLPGCLYFFMWGPTRGTALLCVLFQHTEEEQWDELVETDHHSPFAQPRSSSFLHSLPYLLGFCYLTLVKLCKEGAFEIIVSSAARLELAHRRESLRTSWKNHVLCVLSLFKLLIIIGISEHSLKEIFPDDSCSVPASDCPSTQIPWISLSLGSFLSLI